ncbi:hypothetical protein [Shinella granuli]|uniref:Uncharacterized protein n=1 Tax=Shinella granuli TaxID=323621 RepID=A0A4R2D0K2_SHIGR|nr:hypothetical protein [Shinella granuli]TCN47251.1 hypothetical protein EV665_103426 [Shinella granuli]
MPMQTVHRLTNDPTPAQRLARAIKDIDRRLDWIHRNNLPVPLNAYRARRILHEALARCRERNSILPPAR